MKTVLKGLALLLVIACAVWLAVLWHWQRTVRDVSTADVVYWLVVLPLLLFAAVLLLRWAWRAVVLPARAAAAAAAVPATTPAAPAAAPASKDAAAPALLLASAVHLPGASSPAALDEALRDQTIQPQPDTELADDDGLPVHAARLPELDLDALAEDADVLAAQPRTLRALAALVPVVDEMTLALPPAPEGVASTPAAAGSPTALRVLLHLPDDTSADDRELAQAWLRRRLVAAAPEWADTLQLRVLSGPVLALWQQVEQVLAALTQERKPDLLLVAATHSELDAEVVSRWADQRVLFHAQRQPRGRMPGEGAAALLLAPPATLSPGQPAPRALLHRALWAQRSQPVDAPGRVSSQTLESMVGALLEAAHLAPGQLPALACDVDRHGVRNGELFGAVIARLPHLDALQDVRALGAACGHQGAVGLLASVALAAHVASEPPEPPSPEATPTSPCLVLNLDDPSWRLGLLVSAPPAPHPVT